MVTRGTAAKPAPVNIFTVSGTWLAFVSPDKSVWRPDGSFLGYIQGDDLFDTAGIYVGSVQQGILVYVEERRSIIANVAANAPAVFPGYPGVPSPTLIRPLAPGDTLEGRLAIR